MSSERWAGNTIEQRAKDVLESIEAIRTFTFNMKAEEFGTDRLTRSAVGYELLRISEACGAIRRLQEDADVPPSERMESRYQHWKRVCALANVLRHEYAEVDYNIVWNTATQHEYLTKLEAAIRTLLKTSP